MNWFKERGIECWRCRWTAKHTHIPAHEYSLSEKKETQSIVWAVTWSWGGGEWNERTRYIYIERERERRSREIFEMEAGYFRRLIPTKYIYIYVCVCMCACVCLSKWMCQYVLAYKKILCIFIRTYMCVCMCVFKCARACFCFFVFCTKLQIRVDMRLV